jgi:hypothetical protein
VSVCVCVYTVLPPLLSFSFVSRVSQCFVWGMERPLPLQQTKEKEEKC